MTSSNHLFFPPSSFTSVTVSTHMGQSIACFQLKMYSFSSSSLLLYFLFSLLATFRCPCTGSTCPSCVAHLDVGPTSARPPAPERHARLPTWHSRLALPINRAPPYTGTLLDILWLNAPAQCQPPPPQPPPQPPRPMQYNASVSVPDSSGPERYVPPVIASLPD